MLIVPTSLDTAIVLDLAYLLVWLVLVAVAVISRMRAPRSG